MKDENSVKYGVYEQSELHVMDERRLRLCTSSVC